MKFNELQIKKIEPEKNVITVNEQNVTVYDIIPAQEQFNLVMATVDKSKQNGIYNPYLVELYLTIYIVSEHTDIEFEADDWNDPLALYDKIKNSGLFDAVVAHIPKETIENYLNFIDRVIEAKEKTDLSIVATINNYLEEFPKLMEQASDIVNNFDPDKYQNLVNIAETVNGNRPIPQK